MILWVTAIGSLVADRPSDSNGNTLDKRYDLGDIADAVQTSVQNGPLTALIGIDVLLL